MSGIFESIDRYPVEYLPTGDAAMLIAWAVSDKSEVGVVLCLEDGTAALVPLDKIKFDFRYHEGRWVDVSGPISPEAEGDDADTDPEAGDDGGEEVSG